MGESLAKPAGLASGPPNTNFLLFLKREFNDKFSFKIYDYF